MADKQYVEQVERAKRYLAIFQKITTGIEHTQPSMYNDDQVWSFFQNCYHIKDWIINDPYCNRWKSKVDDFISQNKNLQLCADLCNGSKHYKLTRPERSGESPKIAGKVINLNIEDGMGPIAPMTIAQSYKIVTNTMGSIDAFELAKKCIVAWEQFILANDPSATVS